MTTSDWILETTMRLTSAGNTSARLDTLLLLEYVLQTSRATLLAHPEIDLPATTLTKLNALRTQRLDGVPIAYILNKKEFYGRDYLVNEHVLIPRPETEHMIDQVKALGFEAPRILDMGTGSGCIAITLALEIPHSKITACDISEEALTIAKHNAKALGARATFKYSDLFSALTGKRFDIICANLPYVPEGLVTSTEITKEPRLALFSGTDGLEHYRQFFAQVSTQKPRYIFTEALESQHSELESLANIAGYTLIEKQDLILCFRES